MAAPSCFMLTQFLQPKERDELRKIIKVYKDNRKEIFESYIFPIGTEPNNASWTGFQVYHPEKNSGYLMVFRELHNPDRNGKVKLKFIEDKKIKITDLENNSVQTGKCINGFLNLVIDHPAGYKFLKYEIIN